MVDLGVRVDEGSKKRLIISCDELCTRQGDRLMGVRGRWISGRGGCAAKGFPSGGRLPSSRSP